uniref:Uncharacterized protein n=1 Tax=Setaria italica TaxID=4555 RepID=K3ZL19_SETIT
MVPGEMQRMHSWYTRACRLGLKDLWAQYPPDQPVCFVFCGYYVCEHIRVLGRYTTDLECVSGSFIGNKELLNAVIDLCSFILHEVVNPRGSFYHPGHSLA